MKKKHRKQLIGNGLGQFGKDLFKWQMEQLRQAQERLKAERTISCTEK